MIIIMVADNHMWASLFVVWRVIGASFMERPVWQNYPSDIIMEHQLQNFGPHQIAHKKNSSYLVAGRLDLLIMGVQFYMK